MRQVAKGSRVARFVGVGALGFAVQLIVLYALTASGVAVALAAMLAVVAALAHNFAWHTTWTWRDRSAPGMWARFARFVGSTGTISVAGNVALTSALAAHGTPVLAANGIAVAVCSLANFVVADRWVFVLVAVALSAPQQVEAAELTPGAIAQWEQYVRASEARIDEELRAARLSQNLGSDEWSRVRGGEIVVLTRDVTDAAGTAMSIPGSLIHHWRAVAFLPGVSLNALLTELQAPTSRAWTPPDVRAMRITPGPASSLLVAMRIARGGIVPVTYDTVHRVHYTRHTARFASSRSVSTRIVEIVDAGTPQEHALPEGHDHGFLWRLNAYWRYTHVDGGVLVECESISLSRDVPGLLRPVAGPIIERVSRDSLRATMLALRKGFAGKPNSE